MNDPTKGQENEPMSKPQPAQQQSASLSPPPIRPSALAQSSPDVIANGLTAEATCPNCLRIVFIEASPPEHKIYLNCTTCTKPLTVFTFPRITAEPKSVGTGIRAEDGDATCQFFPQLKAEIFCDECGCFMSHKAAVEWGDKGLCLPCLHNLRENKEDLEFRSEMPLWDNRALALSFTAVYALILLYKHRNSPRSWIPRGSFRWWLALVLSVGFTSFYLALIVFIFVASY